VPNQSTGPRRRGALQPPSEPKARTGESEVQRFYEAEPYPDLGAKPKNPARWLTPALAQLEISPERPLRYLDAGCGTGHSVVGVALKHPDWAISAIDLSGPSLDVARELAAMHGATIDFRQGSYLDPLPFEGSFDLIGSFGSVHHTPDPPGAVRNLLSALAPDGIFVMHLYGKDLDRGKFVIREALDILEPDITNVERRFALYRELVDKQRPSLAARLLDLSPRVVLRGLRNLLRDARRARGESWSPSWRIDFREPSSPWIDHFCHPLEKAYNVRNVEALATAAGLEVITMLSQGREDLARLPPNWRPLYDALDRWDRRRLMELLDITARSVMLIGRKARLRGTQEDVPVGEDVSAGTKSAST